MLTFVPANAQHIGRREEQQDSFGFSDPDDRVFTSHGGLLGVVADGMGGLADGSQASQIAVRNFLPAYRQKDPHESICAALQRSLVAANTAVLSLSDATLDRPSSGTTLAAVVLHEATLYWISVGDTRLYLLRSGQLARINADHNRMTELWADVATGRVDRESALDDRMAPHLTSYLGQPDIRMADISLRPFPLMQDDIVIVCTDGVYRALSEREIIETFRDHSPAHACEALKALVLAKAHAKQDNLTIIAVQCKSKAAAPSATLSQGVSRRTILISALSLEVLLAAGLGGSIGWREWQRYKAISTPVKITPQGAPLQPLPQPIQPIPQTIPQTRPLQPPGTPVPSPQTPTPTTPRPARGTANVDHHIAVPPAEAAPPN